VKRDSAELLGCMLLASAALVWAIWVVPYIPTADGPQHVFSAHVENHYADPGSIYPDYYRILPEYASKGFALVFGPLEAMLPWRVALRITWSIVALALAWGFAGVVLAIDRTRRANALLGFAVALPWSMYLGFFPFVIGTALGLFTLAFVIAKPPENPARLAIASALLFAQAVSHVFSAALTGVVVAVILIGGAQQRVRAIGRIAIVGAPAFSILALSVTGRRAQETSAALEWGLATRAEEISRYFCPGPSWRGWIVIALVVFGLGATLVRRAPPLERRIAWIGVAFFLLTLLSPIHLPAWQLAAPRFAGMATLLGIALVGIPHGQGAPRPDTPETRLRPLRASRSAAVARALVPVACAVSLASSLVYARLNRELAAGCADALAGLDAPLHFSGPRFPIVIGGYCGAPRDRAASPVPWAAMAHNVNLLYLVDHGGVAARLFNGVPSAHAIAFAGSRMPPPPDPHAREMIVTPRYAEDPPVRDALLTELAADGMPFEGIHVVGARPNDIALFRARGYVTELEHGSLLVARFEGCQAELDVPPGAVSFSYGLFSPLIVRDTPRVLANVPLDRAAAGTHVPIPGRPCGPIWIRVALEGDRSCEVVATPSRARPVVSCAE
jgi:hypothetical protein